MSSMYPSFGGAPARPCARCGTPLASNETQCSRCGTYNPLPQGQQFGMFQQGAQGGGSGTSGPLWGGQAQQYQQAGNGAWPGNQDASASAWGSRGQAGGWPQNPQQFGGQGQSAQSAPPSQPLQQNLFGSSFFAPNQSSPFQQNPNQSAFNNSFGGAGLQQNGERPSPNAFFQATRQNGYAGTSAMAPNRPAWMKRPGDEDEDDGGKGKNRPSMGVVIVIVVLLVVLLGGGGFGGYYFYKHRNDGGTTNTTNNGPKISTPTTTPLFSDFFKNNNAGWNVKPPTGAKVTLAGDGKLMLESDDNKVFPELLPGGKTFGDFRLDVDAELATGDTNNGYGVYIRAASTQNDILGTYYRFEVYGDGSFVIYEGVLDANGNSSGTPLKSSGPNNAIAHAGTSNHLTIIAKGQTLTFIVNNTTVVNFTDPTYKSGTIALFVSQVAKATTNAQAIFQNLAIFPAQ